MALFVDFVGLNTLIQEPIDVETNTIGTSAASRPSSGSTDANEVRNTSILTIDEGDYLTALNAHRSGPYGFSIFKQVRAGQNPILRRQMLDNTFSHYRTPGKRIKVLDGKERRIFNERRQPLEHYSEVPVVSKHKPLRMIGSVTTMDQKNKLDKLEPVRVFTTLGNQTQYFSNKPLNQYYGTDEVLHKDYENFIDLYLEGGIDGDESPIDEFRLLTYRQVVYPKELYTYKNHTRNRINFVSRYWRDDRDDRTLTLVDNGFGFNIISQSAWVLDGEENFANLSYTIVPGAIYFSHPNTLFTSTALVASGSENFLSTSAPSITFPENGSVAANTQKRLLFTNLKGTSLRARGAGYTPIRGVGGWPNPVASQGYVSHFPFSTNYTGPDPESAISSNPWDIGVGVLEHYAGTSLHGVKKYLQDTGFSYTHETDVKAIDMKRSSALTNDIGWSFNVPGDQTNWRLKTSASSISTWLGPAYPTPDAADSATVSFLSGNLYYELVDIGGGVNKISKMISFDPANNGNVVVKLGTVFTASHDGSLVYRGANESGSVEYRTNNFYGVDNPIFKAAKAFNGTAGSDDRTASLIAATSNNHLFVEFDLSGSEPSRGIGKDTTAAERKKRGDLFIQKNSAPLRNYARVYVNGSASAMVPVGENHDPYRFLSGSEANLQGQVVNGNTSFRLPNVSALDPANRDDYYLHINDFPSINPFASTGFSFTYWIKFDESISGDNNHIFTIFGSSGPIIDHTIDSNGKLTVGLAGTFTGNDQRLYSATYNNSGDYFETGIWYNVVFTIRADGTNMSFDMQLFKKGETTEETLTSKGLVTTNYGATLTKADFNQMHSSAAMKVLAAGTGITLIRHPATTVKAATNLDSVSIDDLAFFNGPLTDHQMASLVSGSASNQSGVAGNAPAPITTERFPSTDRTTALEVTNTPASLVSARKIHELNTYRGTIDGVLTKQNTDRGDMYFPFGSNYSAKNFQDNVIDGGLAGRFDVGFWFKCSHEPYRTRALEFNGLGYHSKFKTSIGEQSSMHKGLQINFWMKLPTSGVGLNYLPIMEDTEKSWGVLFGWEASNVNALIFYTGWPGEEEVNMTFCTESSLGINLLDNEWHFITIQWNGKHGSENMVSFQVDDLPRYQDRPNVETNGSYGQYTSRRGGNQQQIWDLGDGTLHEVVVGSTLVFRGPGSNDPFNGGETPPYTQNKLPVAGGYNYDRRVGYALSQLSNLTIIQDATNPTDFDSVRSLLYNSGQWKDWSDSDISTELTNQAVNNGTARLENRAPNKFAPNYAPYSWTETDSSLNSGLTHFRRYANSQFYRAVFVAEAPAGGWTPASFSRQGGWAMSFLFGTSATNITRQSNAQVICGLYDIHGTPLIELFLPPSGAGYSNNYLYARVTVGTSTANPETVLVRWSVPFSSLSGPQHIILTWNGGTNGSGDIIDCKLYLNAVERTFDTSYASNNSTSINNAIISSHRKPYYYTIGSTPGDSNYWQYDMIMNHIYLFPNYLGGGEAQASDARRSLNYRQGSGYQLHVQDPAFYFPSLGTFTGNSQRITIQNNTEYLPPVVDCDLSPRGGGGYIVNTDYTVTLYNRASKTPVIAHQYRLGSEAIIRDTPVNNFVRNSPALPNLGNNVPPQGTSDLVVNGTTRLVPCSRHWNVDWISSGGSVDVLGNPHTKTQNHDQSLFYVGDIYNNVTPRDNHGGVELYLSGAGGHYELVSGIARDTTDEIGIASVTIVPNRWYHLYAQYIGFNGSYPQLFLYLNGNGVGFNTKQAGVGNFDTMIKTSYSAGYRPTIGGVKSSAGNLRTFSGYFQDIVFYDGNGPGVSENRRFDALNTYDGIRPGSMYIDTSNANLQLVHKTGYQIGESTATITKIAGSATTSGDLFTNVSTNTAYVTGPPISMFRNIENNSGVVNSEGFTVVAFWAKLNGSQNEEEPRRIVSLFSDTSYAKNSNTTAPEEVKNPTDTFIGADQEIHHLRFGISLKPKANGQQTLRIREGVANLDDPESSYSSQIPVSLSFRTQEIASAVSISSESFAHNVVFIGKDIVYWYQNGSLVGSTTLETSVNYDDTHLVLESIINPYDGWNHAKVLGEDDPLVVGEAVDEVAILYYALGAMALESSRTTLAQSLYNGGSVYNYSIKEGNLYAWWRMGESSGGSPITNNTNLAALTKIDDSSNHPTGVQNTLVTAFGNRVKTIERGSGDNTDLKNLYKGNGTKSGNHLLPLGSFSGQLTDYVGGRNLTTFNGSAQWETSFTYDSYFLHPLNWLACEGNLRKTVITGDNNTDGTPRLHSQHGGDSPANGNEGYAYIGDFAIFSGVSTASDKTAPKTLVQVLRQPTDGEIIHVLINPRNVNSGRRNRFIHIDGSVTSGNSTTFDNTTGIAIIGINDTPTISTITAKIKAALDDSQGLGTTDYTTTISTTTNTDDQITISGQNSAVGKNGEYEVVFKQDDGNTDLIKTVSVIGYDHITKALTRAPNFGWVDQRDSDFSRTTNQGSGLNTFGGLVKPYWYNVATTRDAETNKLKNLGESGSPYNLNQGLDGIVHEHQGANYYRSFIDSGSVIKVSLGNSPTLDANDITLHTSSYFNNFSMPNFQSPGAPTPLIGGSTGARSQFGPGLLQNSYNQFAQEIKEGTNETIDTQLSASACYFRRHSLTASTSVVSPNSGFLQKLSASHNLNSPATALLGNMSSSHLFLGSARWEAGDFAGYFGQDGNFIKKPKKPFYDNYQSFISDARPIMKDYGVVPEFRISEHVSDYLQKGPTEQKLDFLNITGGLASADSSEKQDFYEIYSTTDFLKHFKVVQEDHSDFVDPFAIRLKCSVVKKFLPYEGFYPAQRTTQVAQQFYSSYSDNINITASSPRQYDLTKDKNYGIQYLLNPLFSPGIMFNTIKSGVAVDYPLITDTGSVQKIAVGDQNGGAMITQQFDTRIPFEALIEPEKHLANITLAGNEPDPSGDTGIEVEWGGQGDQLYNMMISNFLAETSEFFLENKSFTSLSSLSQGDANFGNAQKGNIYMMRLKMFRNTKGNKPIAQNYLSKSYGVPQDSGEMTEGFTMYSRPSAFGPPQRLSGSGFTALTWADFKFDGTSGSVFIEDDQSPYFDLKELPFQHDFSYVTGATYGAPYGGTSTASGAIGNEAHKGYNYPFTPPYYHGEAWADITFIPKETKKYSLQEIINQSSVEFYRYFAGSGSLQSDGCTPTETPILDRIHKGGGFTTLSHVHDRTVVINDQAMQIASSVNIFSQGVLEQDISAQGASGINDTTNVQVDTDVQNKYRWIIQTKFETPMLNFNHYTYGKHTNESARDGYLAKPDGSNVAGASSVLPLYTDNTYGIELPGVGPMQTPIGMWHQYGHIPQNSKEGVFLQVDDVPQSWIRNAMLKPLRVAKRYRSLANLCGFSTDPVRMGEIAGVKEISEAVVAIPFLEKEGRRRFFTMNREQIKFAQDPSKVNLVGRTIVDMVNKMKKFVIPPSLDFVANEEIKPFSMYIFEFTHNLTKQDLSDIWQNLPPDLNETVQTDEVSISHQLLAYELLGKGGEYKKGQNSELELNRNDRLGSINPDIQWMVFKVKQRAKTSYFEKIFARNESQQLLSQRLKLGVTADTLGRKNKVSFNWPYDFFSMIEGVKMDAEVHFFDVDEIQTKEQEKPVVKPVVKAPPQQQEENKTNTQNSFKAVSGLVSPQELSDTAAKSSTPTQSKTGTIIRNPRHTNNSIKK